MWSHDRALVRNHNWSKTIEAYEDKLKGKAPNAGKDSGQEEKGVTDDEMAGWHH